MNRLAAETSPYLLQHQHNPVDWWGWNDAALKEARNTGKPILLSIGYSACHWCHVMAHESFEDMETANLMNRLFVNIKVDREERPDIDTIYMSALHALGEQGGWPLTMFLNSAGEPFWGGTYFPNEERFGRPSFKRVLTEIERTFRREPEKITANARAILQRLKARPAKGKLTGLDDAGLADLAGRMVSLADMEHGGMKGAPKFPQYPFFWFLWRAGVRYDINGARQAVIRTLEGLCQGGIYDHLAGGFARYSVDERWLVPHFEKMLYDNALITDLLTEVALETQVPLFRTRVGETIDWILSEMRVEDGGFAASYDADSEGEEGKFYVWTLDEIGAVLGSKDAEFFASHFDVTPGGNFEGHTILNRLAAPRLADSVTETRLNALKVRLLNERRKRVPPGFDDKVLTDWNGMMITTLAKSGRAFDQPLWIEAAFAAYQFIKTHLQVAGRLRHSYRAGKADAPATAADYANMIRAALSLHQLLDPAVSRESPYLEDAIRWTDVLQKHYWLPEGGGYAFTADDTEGLIVRTRAANDDATPNANATMLENLVRLYLFSGEDKCLAQAAAILNAFASELTENVAGFTGLLAGAIDLIAPQHLVIVGESGKLFADDATKCLLEAALSQGLPGAVIQHISSTGHLSARSPIRGKTAIGGRPTAYFCAGPTCGLPSTEPEELISSIRRLRSTYPAASGVP